MPVDRDQSWQHAGTFKVENCTFGSMEGLRRRKPAEILDEVKRTMDERSLAYGDDGRGEQAHAAILSVLFPAGMPTTPEMVTLNMIIAKVVRYALAPGGKGHEDSAHDIIGYAAILDSYHERNAG